VRPAQADFFLLGQPISADYTCADNLSGTTCEGTIAQGSALDTAMAGGKTFVVGATDGAGNPASLTVTYAVGYQANPLYDTAKLHKSGSTIPIKLQLFDHAGGNISNAELTVRAVGVRPVGSNASVAANSPGNSNPDAVFRFDPALDTTGGGYEFNLKTTGLAPGRYNLYFVVGDAAHVYATEFQVR
jgi:hypothetical protein